MKDIIFLDCEICNFMLFGNVPQKVILNKHNGITYINGINIDNGGGNAIGKTTILSAIFFALYDRSLDKVKKDQLVNRINSSTKNCKMYVTLNLIINGINVSITRSIFKKGTSVEIIYDGKDITLDSITNNNSYIEKELIGLSYEMFKMTVIFNGSDTPFLDRDVNSQRLLLEELLSIAELGEKALKVKETQKTFEKSLDIKLAVTQAQEMTISLQNKNIQKIQEKIDFWDKDKALQISNLKSTLSIDIDAQIINAQYSLYLLLQEKLSEIDKYKKEYKSLKESLRLNQNKNDNLTTEIKHLSNDKCPYCSGVYSSPQKIIDLKEQVSICNLSQLELEDKITISQQNIDVLEEEIKNIKCDITLDNIEYLHELSQNRNIIEKEIENIEATINPHIETLEDLMEQEVPLIDYTEIDNLKDDIEHCKFLHKLLTDKNSVLRKKIITKNIKKLNVMLQKNLHSFGLPHKIIFEGDMSVTIHEFDHEIGYGGLSNGEKKRVNLSLLCAFREIRCELLGYVNILFADEIDAGALCTKGMEDALNVFTNICKNDKRLNVYLISHRDLMINRFKHEIFIEKENGFSTFTQIEHS